MSERLDDGASTRDLSKAQVILVGVSRCGKTPTSLYLALQFGIRAANFPLTPDDFADHKLPASVLPWRSKLFGLTIQPERLRQIRQMALRPAAPAIQGVGDQADRSVHDRMPAPGNVHGGSTSFRRPRTPEGRDRRRLSQPPGRIPIRRRAPASPMARSPDV